MGARDARFEWRRARLIYTRAPEPRAGASDAPTPPPGVRRARRHNGVSVPLQGLQNPSKASARCVAYTSAWGGEASERGGVIHHRALHPLATRPCTLSRRARQHARADLPPTACRSPPRCELTPHTAPARETAVRGRGRSCGVRAVIDTLNNACANATAPRHLPPLTRGRRLEER